MYPLFVLFVCYRLSFLFSPFLVLWMHSVSKVMAATRMIPVAQAQRKVVTQPIELSFA